MSLGSDYLQGVAIGQKERLAEQANAMDYLNMIKSSKPMSGVINLGQDKVSSRDLYMKAQEEALKRKQQEINQQAGALRTMTEQARANEERLRERHTQQADYWGKRAKEEENRALGYREIAGEEAAESKDEALNNAMRGFYSYSGDAVKSYFDRYGAKGISIQGVGKGPNGEVIVDFGEGRRETYASPVEAIERLLIPAAAIMSQQKSKGGRQASETSYEKALRERYTENVKAMNDPMNAENPEFMEQKRKENDEIERVLEQFAFQKNKTYGQASGSEALGVGDTIPQQGELYVNQKTGEMAVVYPDGRVEPIGSSGPGAGPVSSLGAKEKQIRRPILSAKTSGEKTDHNFIEFVDKKSGEKRRAEIRGNTILIKRFINGKWEVV
ncbi:MAG: hypothetical protein JW925_12585 [Syntrophaceae bacterium]|nr:hypothetical protein [Syntrophaceae bacterium]